MKRKLFAFVKWTSRVALASMAFALVLAFLLILWLQHAHDHTMAIGYPMYRGR